MSLMKEFTKKVNSVGCIFSLLLLFIQYPLGSHATCNCQLQNDSTPLTLRQSPPNFSMNTLVPLTNIQPGLNYHNLTELYVKVVERFQSLSILKQLMVSLSGQILHSTEKLVIGGDHMEY